MKLFTTFLFCAFTLSLNAPVSAQTSDIVGSWRLVKKTNCQSHGATAAQAGKVQPASSDDGGAVPASPQIVNFRDNATAEESARILNSNRTSRQKKFFYKFNGDMLLILDKKTQTITDNYLVDKFSGDSLIVSNKARPCEIKFFVKIKDGQAN